MEKGDAISPPIHTHIEIGGGIKTSANKIVHAPDLPIPIGLLYSNFNKYGISL